MEFGPQHDPPSRTRQHREVDPVSREQVHVVIHPSPPPATAPAPPEAPNEKSAPTNIHKVECWVFDKASSPTTSHTTGAFTKAEVIKWLKEPNLASTNSVKPAAGLRLLLREQKTSIEWPFEKSTFAAIQEALGMPATSSYLHLPKSGACGKYLGTPGHPVFIYNRSNNNGAISTVIKYDSTTNITTGYVLLGPRISLEAACAQICSQFPQFSHPLIVPTVLGELTACDLMRELYHINRLLTVSEYKTRSGDWEIQDSLANAGALPVPAAAASDPTVEPEPSWHDEAAVEMLREPPYWAHMSREMTGCKDNHHLARILGWLACRFAFMHAAVNCGISMVEFTLKELEGLETYVAPSVRRRFKTTAGKGDVMNSAGLLHRVEMLESNLRHVAVFGAIEPRMQAQQTMLFNIINIGIARDSKELAEASKRDSSAMKIIAVLTTFFLPGTFIAAFFAMPILDWQAFSMGDVMTKHFWFYWAVAIPLTIVVMSFVGVYGWVQAKRNREASKKAREEAGFPV